MPHTIETGTWKGCVVRRARKPGRCQYWMGKDKGGMCSKRIEAGDKYFEGENDNWKAGGFAMKRFCMDHLKEEG